MKKEIKNVILYCRVSTDEQAKGTSLDYQEARLREHCLRYNYNIIECYREDFSGKTFQRRPEMRKIMAFCRIHPKQVDAMLFLRWDRYSRNLEFALTNIRQLRDLNITVNSIENPLDQSSLDNPTMLGVYIGNAESEVNKIAKRTREGIMEHKGKGACTSMAPFGYRNVRIDDDHKFVEVVKENAKIVVEIFNQVAKGIETPNYIRKQFKRKSGFKLCTSAYFNMLRNHFYIGEIFVPEFEGKPSHYVNGVHEAIIDKATFYKVQEILDGKRKDNPRLSKKIHPDAFLRNYLKCPVCGGTITGAPSKSGNGNYYFYYHCSPNPKHFRCRAEEAIEKFVSYTASIKPNKEVLALYYEVLCDVKGERNTQKKNEVEELKKDLAKVKKRLESLEDMYIDGEITKDAFNNASKRYTSEISAIEEQIDFITNPNRTKIEPKLRYSISLISSIDKYVKNEKVEVKCKLLSSIFPQKMTFDGNSYRTDYYNTVLDLICKQTNELRGVKSKSGKSFDTLSTFVPSSRIELLSKV